MKDSSTEKASYPAKAANILSYLWPAAALLIPLSMAVYAFVEYSSAPFQDQWFEIFWLKSYYAGEARVSDVWRLHNSHPIIFPRLFYLIDLFAFRGANVFLLLSAFLIQASACALLVREAWTARDLSRPLARFLAGVYLVFMFSARQYGNFTWAFQVQFVLVFAAAVAAAVCFARYADSDADAPASIKWLIAALVAATIATLSMANGIFIWPAFIAVALASKRPRVETILVAAAFAVLVAFLLLMGFEGRGLGPALSHPADAFLFFLRYLGSPFTMSLPLAATVGGLGLTVGAALCVVNLLRSDRLTRFRRVHIILIIFVVFAAAATSVGRFDMSIASPFSSRYTTASFIFWASIVSLLILEASQSRRWRRMAVLALICCVVVVCAISVAPLHLDGRKRAEATRRVRDQAALALVVGIRDKGYVRTLCHWDPDQLVAALPMLREKRLGMFNHDWAGIIGRDIRVFFEVSETNLYQGQWEGAYLLEGEDDPARTELRLEGWAWDRTTERPPPLILFVDDSGVIRGVARPNNPRRRFLPFSGGKTFQNSGWTGFALCEKGNPLRAYALSADGTVAHRFPGMYVKKR